VGVEHRSGVLREAVDRRVDAIAGALDVAFAGEPPPVIAHFHQAARRHLGPIEAERDLIVAVIRARHAEGQVIEDAFVEPPHHADPVRCREIDPRLPARGLEVDALLDGLLQHPSLQVVEFDARPYSGLKFIATPLMQYLKCVGGGPSGNTWPRWLPQRLQCTSVRTMP
jgi:hypothetical protein